MTHDRNYLRMLNDCELSHYASENVRTELEFVLLERLEQAGDLSDQLETAQDEIKDLTEDRDYWQLVAQGNDTLRDDTAE
jgi:hypothetical protein